MWQRRCGSAAVGVPLWERRPGAMGGRSGTFDRTRLQAQNIAPARLQRLAIEPVQGGRSHNPQHSPPPTSIPPS